MKYIRPVINREAALNSVGSGWASLVNKAYDYLAQHPNVTVVQVKEKFGGLRIYTDVYDEEIDNFIISLEKESFEVCEECGERGNLRAGSWYRTLCDLHANGREIIQPF